MVDQTQTKRYILRFEPLLYIFAFTQKDFHYVHTWPSTKGPPLRKLNIGSTQLHSLNTNLYRRGKAQSQSKEKITILMIQWSQILRITNNFSHKNKILKIGLELIAQVWENKVFWKRNNKEKLSRKNFLIDKEMKNKTRITKYWFYLIFQKLWNK